MSPLGFHNSVSCRLIKKVHFLKGHLDHVALFIITPTLKFTGNAALSFPSLKVTVNQGIHAKIFIITYVDGNVAALLNVLRANSHGHVLSLILRQELLLLQAHGDRKIR